MLLKAYRQTGLINQEIQISRHLESNLVKINASVESLLKQHNERTITSHDLIVQIYGAVEPVSEDVEKLVQLRNNASGLIYENATDMIAAARIGMTIICVLSVIGKLFFAYQTQINMNRAIGGEPAAVERIIEKIADGFCLRN